MDKPPLGIMPKYLFEENRIIEIIKALTACSNYSVVGNCRIMLEWTKELTDRLEYLIDRKKG